MTTRRRLVAAALALPVAGFAIRTQAQDATPATATETGIAYADRDGTPLLLDVYLPTSGTPPFPAVLLFHGGAWTYGISGPMDMAGPAAALAADGYAAFNIAYRLTGDPAGAHVWPDQLDDAQQAVRWVRANAERYGIDPNRVAAYGHSAGGHLASHLGVRETRDDSEPGLAGISSRVQGVISIAGHMDFGIPYPQEFDRESVTALLGGAIDEIPDVYADASPITWVDGSSAPFLIIHGGADDMNPPAHARTMAAALQEAGVTVVSVEDAVGNHFTVADWSNAGPWTLAFLGAISGR
jgi:acetyl esterase/lipase